MNKEKDALVKMLRENKISQEEYQLLLNAVDKQPSPLARRLSLLINPFQKIAGIKALVLGLIMLVAASYIGTIAKVYTIGVLGCLNAAIVKHAKLEPDFLLLLAQNLLVWLVLTGLFILAAKICRQKRLRWVDFFGTVALARFPFLILVSLIAVLRVYFPEVLNIDLSKGLDLHPTLATSLFNAGVMLCFAWILVTYFYALKEASGLIGKKLWLSYAGALILGDVVTSALTMGILK